MTGKPQVNCCNQPGFVNNLQNLLKQEAAQVRIAQRKESWFQTLSMTNPNTLERWRPHPLVYFYCSLTIVFLGIACSWGITLLVAQRSQPESTMKAAILGMGLFVVVSGCHYGDARHRSYRLSVGCYCLPPI